MAKLWRLIIAVAAFGLVQSQAQETINSLAGTDVALSCPLDAVACGALHSVKWYRGGGARVAVYSDDLKVQKLEGPQKERLTIVHSPEAGLTQLKLSAVEVPDEDSYTCEGTFLAPQENCDSVRNVQLNVMVPPSEIILADDAGKKLYNSSVLGPLREGGALSLFCEAVGGRPAPEITWRRAGSTVKGITNIQEVGEGLFTARSQLSLLLDRKDLGASVQCSVDSPALTAPIVSEVELDLQVRPTKIDVTGVQHHVVQGTKVLLQCLVLGARPAANITWYNGTTPISNEDDRTSTESSEQGPSSTTGTTERPDGTFETLSQLVFTASRWENGNSVRCEGDNAVLREDMEKPIHDEITLEVLYPPVVRVRPENLTVNETEDILLFCEYEANPASLDKVKWLKDDKVLDLSLERFEGGTTEQQALVIHVSSREDIGWYTCELTNHVGTSRATNSIDVDVYYKPVVALEMDPEGPIIDGQNSLVTLLCQVTSGNPARLTDVRWYLNGTLLQKLPECHNDTYNDTEEDNMSYNMPDLCNVDPAQFELRNVDRNMHGNYSCEGRNEVGWGEVGAARPVVVFYPPGDSVITRSPGAVVKGGYVTLSCTLEDGGRPEASRFRWLRGSKASTDVVTDTWTIDPVTLAHRSNFSCFGVNDGGNGERDTLFLDVQAAPSFINKLGPYTGALFSTTNLSIECRVECQPACSIAWYRDGQELGAPLYYVEESFAPADNSTGDFESTLSVLHWNMTAWPGDGLDIHRDSGNYTCSSSDNVVGVSVHSTTFLGVEYPPVNATVSAAEVSVTENHVPPRVVCSAKGYPDPTYQWRRQGELVSKGNSLILNRPVSRGGHGAYTCEATNKHGSAVVDTLINVLYKPECVISVTEVDGEAALACSATANPQEVSFTWLLKTDNDTTSPLEQDGSVSADGHSSMLVLDDSVEAFRTYLCVANNSAGVGEACERDVPVNMDRARNLVWWRRWDKETLIILVAAVVGLVLAVIIVCVLIIILCRRKRKSDKYHSTLYEDRQSPECLSATATPRSASTFTSTSPTSSNARSSVKLLHQSKYGTPIGTSVSRIPRVDSSTLEDTNLSPISAISAPSSPPRWPLRPGVLVHVNTAHSLCAARKICDESMNTISVDLSHTIGSKDDADASGTFGNTRECNEDTSRTRSGVFASLLNIFRLKQNVGRKQNGGKTNRRAVSLLNIARAGDVSGCRLKTIFSAKSQDLPGIVGREDTGVVSFKKFPRAPTGDSVEGFVSRKRKKPGQAPDKSAGAPPQGSDTDEPPGLYENLPFHGLQSAPNKTARPNQNVLRVAPTPKSSQITLPSHIHKDILPANTGFDHTLQRPTWSFEPALRANNLQNPFLTRSESIKARYMYPPMLNYDDMPTCYGSNSHLSYKNSTDRKCHSLKTRGSKKPPNFYSMRVTCKKHNALTFNYDYNHARQRQPLGRDAFGGSKMAANKTKQDEHIYENLTDSIQIYENDGNTSRESRVVANGLYGTIGYDFKMAAFPVPAPRKKNSHSVRRSNSSHIYMNIPPIAASPPQTPADQSRNRIGQANTSEKTTKSENLYCLTTNRDLTYRLNASHPTNGYVIGSPHLVPRTLFASPSNAGAKKPHVKKLIKTPLQKHHSFHFQNNPHDFTSREVKNENMLNAHNEVKLSSNRHENNSRVRRNHSLVTGNRPLGPLVFKPHELNRTHTNEGFQKTEALLSNDDYFQNFLKLRKISRTSMKLYSEPLQPKKSIVYADLVDIEPRDTFKSFRRPTQYATLQFNEPYRPEFSDLDYADVDYRSYGPINYKAASIYAQMKKNGPRMSQLNDNNNDDLL